MKRFKHVLTIMLMLAPGALFMGVTLGAVTPAAAEPVIDITKGNVQPMPIAIPDFAGGGGDSQPGVDIAKVVSDDLERSGCSRRLTTRLSSRITFRCSRGRAFRIGA